MSIPTSLYRLQLRGGVDLAAAEALVPYLDDLGIGALYLSPPFAAAAGSTHGYDVVDANEIEPDLGGREGMESLSAALHGRGMGLIVDIVPNHMAFSLDNGWLRDVLRRGEGSRYARHFDIAWPERLRLPWLDGAFAEQDGMRVEDDADGPVLVAGGLRVPLADGPLVEAARADPARIAELHDAQAWRLTDWRTEGAAITHRRFFSITSLIGMRVEDEDVWDDMHALIVDLAKAGTIDGLRVDHVDGLADPSGYLTRLAERTGLPIWVEKILSGDEAIPEGWATEGETGYAPAADIAAVLTDAGGAAAMRDAFEARAGRVKPFAEVVAEARARVLAGELAAEVQQLTDMAMEAAEGDPVASEWGREPMAAAILGLLGVFPRYRTYGDEAGMPPEDAAMMDELLETAEGPEPLRAFLARALRSAEPEGTAFRLRFQQVTGAAVAKSQEDTAFYRDVALLSANEVGAEPERPALEVAAFHEAMRARLAETPRALTLTSSHDTKRSEDARARILTLTHAPDAFRDWADGLDTGLEPRTEWYLAQSAFALHGAEEAGPRLADHMVKALREEERLSSWLEPDEAVEAAAREAAEAVMAADPEPLPEVAAVADRAVLAQAALKLVIPGIPDVYQGTEGPDFALTDPDNRRPRDWDALRAALSRAGEEGPLPEGAEKMALTARLLRLRRAAPAAFLEGSYEPVDAPDGVLAFARVHGDVRVTVACALPGAGGMVEVGPGRAVVGVVADGMADLGACPVAVVARGA